jgi:hypothetical protein
MSGEPIDWDAPAAHVFDRYWFIDYAEWYLEQDVNNDIVCTLQEAVNRRAATPRDFVHETLDALESRGHLRSAHPYNPNKLALYD